MRVKAARLAEHGQPLRIEEIELPEPARRTSSWMSHTPA
jgi:Zn-dependent alcohol dehydrogenase